MPSFEATSRNRVKSWLGEDGKGDAPNETIDRLLVPVTDWIEARIHNKLDRVAGRTVFPRPNRKGFTRYLYIPFAPIDDDSTFKIETSTDREFSSADEIDPETYHLNAEAGFVELDYPLRKFRPGTVRITATGGLADKLEWASGDAAGLAYLVGSADAGAPANALRGTGESVSQAATMIVGESFRRRRNLARKGTRDASGTIEYHGELAIPKIAMTLLEPVIRLSIRG